MIYLFYMDFVIKVLSVTTAKKHSNGSLFGFYEPANNEVSNNNSERFLLLIMCEVPLYACYVN